MQQLYEYELRTPTYVRTRIGYQAVKRIRARMERTGDFFTLFHCVAIFMKDATGHYVWMDEELDVHMSVRNVLAFQEYNEE